MQNTIIEKIDLDKTQANTFLRALWAEFRNNFEQVGWQYIGFRYPSSTKVLIGLMSLRRGLTLQLEFDYKNKGGINNIYITPKEADENYSEDSIIKCIKNALKKGHNQGFSTFNFSSTIKVKYPETRLRWSNKGPIIHPYAGKNFTLFSDNDHITLNSKQLGFDLIDAEDNASEKVLAACDFLSTCLNTHIRRTNYVEKKLKITPNYNHIVYEDKEWIDGEPYINNSYGLLKEQINIIDKILSSEINTNSPLIKSCTHFNNALSIRADQIDYSYDEIICVLLISSIETLCEEYEWDTTTCPVCKQVKYSIKKKVKTLTEKILGPAASIHISELYDMRSKSLHCGHMISKKNSSKIIPLIDASQNNCMKPMRASFTNLIEFTSYLIRQVAIEQYDT
ncbi:hypothetical protein [Maridesulfovibrio sp. FT414]|uniref:hypothetical protein n=1 Tax=Maridesulfovibrio sp. FT414 TaxID=2979469 RepID=UPI003D801714